MIHVPIPKLFNIRGESFLEPHHGIDHHLLYVGPFRFQDHDNPLLVLPEFGMLFYFLTLANREVHQNFFQCLHDVGGVAGRSGDFLIHLLSPIDISSDIRFVLSD